MKKLLFILPLLLLLAWCTTPEERCDNLSWTERKACICWKIACSQIYSDSEAVKCIAICMESSIGVGY